MPKIWFEDTHQNITYYKYLARQFNKELKDVVKHGTLRELHSMEQMVKEQLLKKSKLEEKASETKPHSGNPREDSKEAQPSQAPTSPPLADSETKATSTEGTKQQSAGVSEAKVLEQGAVDVQGDDTLEGQSKSERKGAEDNETKGTTNTNQGS